MSDIRLTEGHIARHTPQGAGAQGREAAIIDIAQDLLLRELHRCGALNGLAFKGGTSLRKLYAGQAGRFSTDLDFSTVQIDSDPDDVIALLIATVDGLVVGPFTYGITERRGKWTITYRHSFGRGSDTLSSKLDVNPPPWLPPTTRGWRPLPVHELYGEPPLPQLQVIQLAENVAEKISRLNRASPARDMYDLRWIAANAVSLGVDMSLIRHLAVLKVWIDANGVQAGRTWWKPGHESAAFDPDQWLRVRSENEVDTEDIGALTIPAPTAHELSDALRKHYGFLRDLDADERVLAQARERDRSLALRLLTELPGRRLVGSSLY